MRNDDQQLEALQDIRKMMKESSKFLSLSGMSGVFAGVYALAGAFTGHLVLQDAAAYYRGDGSGDSAVMARIILICAAVLVLSIFTAFFLSAAKARKTNQNIFDHTSKKVFWSMAVPLLAGGFFCIALLLHDMVLMVAPAMLLFYGLAILNTSKYMHAEIRLMAYSQLALGLLASFYPGHGLIFWALGFGVLHIVYGIIMWLKYDRNQ